MNLYEKIGLAWLGLFAFGICEIWLFRWWFGVLFPLGIRVAVFRRAVDGDPHEVLTRISSRLTRAQGSLSREIYDAIVIHYAVVAPWLQRFIRINMRSGTLAFQTPARCLFCLKSRLKVTQNTDTGQVLVRGEAKLGAIAIALFLPAPAALYLCLTVSVGLLQGVFFFLLVLHLLLWSRTVLVHRRVFRSMCTVLVSRV